MRYYINIGTNMGNREANLSAAVASVERALGAAAECSGTVESEAWGFESANRFLNMAIAVDSEIEPQAMLQTLKRIEAEMGSAVHRDAQGNYCDRIIDLDIMAIDELVIDTPTLQVPHAHLAERIFFLAPFAQLAPGWSHPTLHRMIEELLSDCE